MSFARAVPARYSRRTTPQDSSSSVLSILREPRGSFWSGRTATALRLRITLNDKADVHSVKDEVVALGRFGQFLNAPLGLLEAFRGFNPDRLPVSELPENFKSWFRRRWFQDRSCSWQTFSILRINRALSL